MKADNREEKEEATMGNEIKAFLWEEDGVGVIEIGVCQLIKVILL